MEHTGATSRRIALTSSSTFGAVAGCWQRSVAKIKTLFVGLSASAIVKAFEPNESQKLETTMIDLSTNEARLALVTPWATKYGLDPYLVCAVIEQESGWNPGAARFEPAFLKKYIEPMNLGFLESLDRSTSWGLMQIMGQTAIEFGFDSGENPAELASLRIPDVGVDFGCRKLQKCFDIHKDPETSLLAYNGGANPEYGKQVLARVAHYKPVTPVTDVTPVTEGAD